MQKTLIILPALFLAVYGSGEVSILTTPSSIEFKGKEKIESDILSDVVLASLGHSVQENAHWSGMYLKDPFGLAKTAVVIYVDGIDHIEFNGKTKSYPLSGPRAKESLDILTTVLEESNSLAVDIDLAQGSESLLMYSDVIGEITVPSNLKSMGNLKPDLHSEDKLFLQQISILNTLSDRLATLQKRPNLFTIRLSMNPLISVHGNKSPAFFEAVKMLTETTMKFAENVENASENELIFFLVADKAEAAARSKRQTSEEDDPSKLNLATFYNEDYPVIFNIILWFGVVFFFSLLSISYAIATMDPGRDSIIYRMTSTRMKKDN